MNYRIINGKILKGGDEKVRTVQEDLFVIDGKVYEHMPEDAENPERKQSMLPVIWSCPGSLTFIRMHT